MMHAFVLAAGLLLDSPDERGKRLLQTVCGGACHNVEFATSRRATKDEWTQTVIAMVKKGADATEEEFEAIVDYLARNFGPRLNVNKATAAKLAEFLELTAAEAAAIVRYRETKGEFKGWPDLKKVRGLPIKKLEPKKQTLEY